MVRKTVGFASAGLAIFSLLVALTVRDRFALTGLIFFASPWLVRLLLVAAGAFFWRPKSCVVRLLLLAVAIHAVWQAGQSFRWKRCGAGEGTMQVTLWNAGHRLSRMPEKWPELVSAETRLVVVIEAGKFDEILWNSFVSKNSGFNWQRLSGGIVVGVKGRIVKTERLGTDRFRCHRVEAEIDGEIFTVLAIDIPSDPLKSRTPFLDKIRASAASERTLILGDFNTPPGVRGFDAWRSRFHFANESRHFGFLETWCYGIPLLTLDQLWISRDLEAIDATSCWTLSSDHERMTFKIRKKN